MHVIWRRPDGFHGASPQDFSVVEVKEHSRLWLHRDDKDEYPFRVSGGWEEKELTKRLNNLVNLLPYRKPKWVEHLLSAFNHSMKEDPKEYYQETQAWLADLKGHLKGDTWEVEILSQAIDVTRERLEEAKEDFIQGAS